MSVESKIETDRLELLEIYKLCVEMADRVSSRRGRANAFFVTLQTALSSITGLSMQYAFFGSSPLRLLPPVLGVVVSIVWWLQLRSYRDLNASKFKVILELERHLAFQAFASENVAMPADKIKGFRSKYSELGFTERVVPWVFTGLYFLVAFVPFLK